jgi:PAS domain S-box-containing protein
LLVEVLTIEFARYQGYNGHWMSFLFIFILGLAFILNHRGHFIAAVWITIGLLSIAIFTLTFVTEGQRLDVDFLNFLFLPLLFTSLFLSENMILVITALYVGTMLSLVFIPGIDIAQVLLGPAAFVTIASGMIYLIFHQRNIQEADRQQELVEREERYRTLLETSYEGICVIADDKILDANPNFARMFGYQLTEVIGKSVLKLGEKEFRPYLLSSIQNQKGHPARVPVYTKEGAPFNIEAVSRMQTYRGLQAQVIAIRDVTERVQAEEALHQNERLYRTLFEGANDAIFLLSFDNIYIAANQKAANMLDYTVQELVGKQVSEVVAPGEDPDPVWVSSALLAGETLPIFERIFRKKDGTEFPVEINTTLVHDRDGKPSSIQSIVRDITERKLAESRIQRHLERLKALREIDRMISASLDLQVTLGNLLNHVVTQLGIDAADILLLNSNLYHLDTYADIGFLPGGSSRELVHMDDKLAGRAASEGVMVRIMDLPSAAENCPRLELLARRGFKVGIAVPLIAKGLVKGVLEVFLRKPTEPTLEWLDFLETLGGQAAIAVDNAELFQNLQRTNKDLVRSYDATLEGWAKALELRDEDTEGHSQRVTEMTLRLGRVLGLSDADLIQLYRGALLHDIGKMGIPDNVLLKPGPLTEEEWVIMKKHPVYANQMLSSIPFLRLAVDIPYYHHERWDGSGYPLGLKGKSIPLAARMFMVVDVWDALSSDRPYRKRWSNEKVLNYIRAQAGIMFDPQIVAEFLDMLEKEA